MAHEILKLQMGYVSKVCKLALWKFDSFSDGSNNINCV
jgi:hypothetical protein